MFYNHVKAKMLLSGYFLMIILAVAFTFISSPTQPLLTDYQIGQALGSLSLTLLTLQFVMSSRFKTLEYRVGLDKIMRWHSLNGKLLVASVFLHPLLLFRPFFSAGLGLSEIVKSFTIYHWFGEAAFVLIILTVFITILSNKLKLNYEHWKIIHRVAYIIVLLGFIHSFKLGSDIIAREPLFYWWSLLAIIALTSIAHRFFFRKKDWCVITKIIDEVPSVRSIYLKPINGRRFNYVPGQFAFVRFFNPQLSQEEHHFTLSSSPLDDELSFTIKESGDYTSQLGKLKVGDKAMLEGPFGVFSNADADGPLVFIAGGIGITPIWSMLSTMSKTNQPKSTTLLYANKIASEIAFKKALDQNSWWLKTVYVLSDEEKDGFYHGFITPQIIKKEVKDITKSKIFLCGPPPMMDSVQKILHDLGVTKQNILTERFALR